MLRGVSGVAAQYEEILRHSEGGGSKAGDGLPNVWEKSRIKKTGFFSRLCDDSDDVLPQVGSYFSLNAAGLLYRSLPSSKTSRNSLVVF